MATATPVALTVPDVMAALQLSRSKVYDLIRSKTLPSFLVGRSRRIAADDLTAYITNQTRNTN
ncbi:helix-turn-helix domain-containing protein [Kitasatospora sp. NPDC004615]|uniref:helix-turn-helix domain-containing protein n=1 Tax=Kitasatospora sp. NPDC004615 TaxID=3364017 RepID=UPI00367ED2F2